MWHCQPIPLIITAVRILDQRIVRSRVNSGRAPHAAMPSSRGRAHVFIVYSDMRKLACDAFGIPCCELILKKTNHWWREPPTLNQATQSAASDVVKLTRNIGRVDLAGYAGPTPYHIKLLPPTGNPPPISHAMRGPEFVEAVAADLKERGVKPRCGRARHLVCVPILGTGYGGLHQVAGEVVKLMLPLLVDAANASGVDVAVVTNEPEAYAAAQAQRRLLGYEWPLHPSLLCEGDALAEQARQDNLVLFMGAGVSMASGLPSWYDLLERLASTVGLGKHEPWSTLEGHEEPLAIRRQAQERREFESMSFLDKARVLQTRLERSGRDLGKTMAAMLTSEHHAIAQALLTTLPCTEAVTTNYDVLFEQAVRACPGESMSVLPMAPDAAAKRWLLKMHGCVTKPEDIVLTRTDYIRYAENNAALGGIVQALMMTKHMLFVGFSLTDDNFHRLFDAVQRARKPAITTISDGVAIDAEKHEPKSGHVGTAVLLSSNNLQREMWGEHLNFVFMRPHESGPHRHVERDHTELARTLEIFLDYMASKCNRLEAHNFLNERFKAQLSPDEALLHHALIKFADDLPPEATRAPAYAHVLRMLEALGGAKIAEDVAKKLQSPAVVKAEAEAGEEAKPLSPLWEEQMPKA